MIISTLLDGAAAPAPGGSGIGSLIMIVLIFVVMYFFMIRPQKKKQQEVQKFQNSLEIGSKVITAGGIYGTVRELANEYLMLEISNGVKIKISRNSVYPSVDSGVATPAQESKL